MLVLLSSDGKKVLRVDPSQIQDGDSNEVVALKGDFFRGKITEGQFHEALFNLVNENEEELLVSNDNGIGGGPEWMQQEIIEEKDKNA